MTLAELARKNCANFHGNKCIVCGPCKVCGGGLCKWFQEAVLPLAPELAAGYWKREGGAKDEQAKDSEGQGFD